MDFLQLLLFLLILSVSFYFHKYFNLDNKEVFTQYPYEALRWLKNEVIYKSLESELQTVSLNPSDDKSRCYQNGNRIYCQEIIRTSDIEKLQKELLVNEGYLKSKLQETLNQQQLYGQIPNIKVLGIAVRNESLFIALEVLK